MILILKTGSTAENIKNVHGDFEDWISNKMALTKSEYHVHFVDDYDTPPLDLKYSGIVITGSPLMVTDMKLIDSKLCTWLLDKQKAEVPILGICFGHQLLNIINGGIVGNNDLGYIIGSRVTNLTIPGKEDELLKDLPEKFNAFKTHSQSIHEIPESSVILSKSNSGIIDAIRFSTKAWGVQFHPEFNSDIMQMYIENKKDRLISEGIDSEIISSYAGTIDYGDKILNDLNI